jgi:hypothetical protein
MRELVDSIAATASREVQVVFYADNDDQPSIDALPALQDAYEAVDVVGVIGPRVTMSSCYNRCAEYADGEILQECCDSVLFESEGWDLEVEAAFAKVPDKIRLVFGCDGIHNGRAATLPFLHRRWVETVGRFMPPYFSCDYCDTWVWEVAKALDRITYLPQVLTTHRHPSVGTAPMDRTHEERMARGFNDDVKAIFDSKADERAMEVEKLRAVML